jgi:hypothetical protein
MLSHKLHLHRSVLTCVLFICFHLHSAFAGFDNMPDEMMILIFSQLSSSMWSTTPLVSGLWNSLNDDRYLWKQRFNNMDEPALYHLYAIAKERNIPEDKVRILEKAITEKLEAIPERVAPSGATFKRVFAGLRMGESWKGPILQADESKAVIWGNTVTNASGFTRRMNPKEAMRYCDQIGARLPTKDEWISFQEAMGAAPGTPINSIPQDYRIDVEVLPRQREAQFWSSTVAGYYFSYYYFDSRNGKIASFIDEANYCVRCVKDI